MNLLNKVLKILSDEKTLDKISKTAKVVAGLVVLVNAISAFVEGLEKAVHSIQSFVSNNVRENKEKDKKTDKKEEKKVDHKYDNMDLDDIPTDFEDDEA